MEENDNIIVTEPSESEEDTILALGRWLHSTKTASIDNSSEEESEDESASTEGSNFQDQSKESSDIKVKRVQEE